MPTVPMNRTRSFLVCLAAYIAAGAVALVAALAATRLAPDRLILAALLADLAATIVVFGFSLAVDNSSLYDPYWSVAPVPIAIFWFLRAGSGGTRIRQLFALALLCAWAVRLTLNCLRRWKGLGQEDWRYADFRRFGRLYWPISFLGFHLFPTVIVFLGCLSLFPALGSAGRPLGILDGMAAAVTATAIGIEWTADRQLRRFLWERSRENRRGELLATGLWGLSRHPNYFGEVLFWWGLWLFGLAAAPSWWWTIAGPVAITAMFLFISVPMMDRRLLARRPEYASLISRHSGLVPWFTAGPSGSPRRRTTRRGNYTEPRGRA
jgi:steroid 5-alpha reductase family enzyme